MSKFLQLWEILIGDEDSFSPENRRFNAMTVLAFVGIFFGVFLNFFIEAYELVVYIVSCGMVLSLFYFLARFKRRFHISRVLFAVIAHVLIVLNYFLNGGINGPTLILEFVIFFLMISVFERKHAPMWVILAMLLPSGAVLFEFYYPESIIATYSTREFRYFDVLISFNFSIIFVVASMLFMRKEYDKLVAKEKKNTAEVEELNLKTKKMFSIVSHDLRSPLATIEGYLKEINESEIEDDIKKGLEGKLLEQTERTAQMLDNILVWSKSHLDGNTPQFERVELISQMGPTFGVMKDIAARKGVLFDCGVAGPVYIFGDPGLIEVLFRNLIQNAIKFTPAGGEVSVFGKKVGNAFQVEITDSGIGMSDQAIRQLFTLNATSTFGTENEKGIGLGMVLCGEIIELHNGTIGVESELNKGTKITVKLPLR